MSEVQQAVFTSARTDRMDGYQLVAASKGVTDQQQEELRAWGPAHDSLLNLQSRLGSINFHRMESDYFCLSKTVPAGSEYSGRSGPKIYTTFLVLAAEQFRRFAYQPFRVLDAAIAGGYLRVARRLPDALPCVRLRGRASVALTSLLEPLSDAKLRRRVLSLGVAASGGAVIISSPFEVRQTLDRLLNLLPLACRAELSFSTGLKSSSQRPFQIQCNCENDLRSQAAARQSHATLVDLESATDDALTGWWATVDEMLQRGQLNEIVELISHVGDEMTLGGLVDWSPALTH